MISGCRSLAEAISAVFGEDVTVESRTPVSGGCINNAARLVLSNGERAFLKENSASLRGMFEAEAEGLDALRAASDRTLGPRVPKPLAWGAADGRQFILMEYIPPGRPGPRYAESFGRMLAALNREQQETRFGFTADNFIGATPQVNTWATDWTTFFGERRLGYQIRLAKRQGVASSSLVRDVERVIERLSILVPTDTKASLLHGDLWSGNAIADADGNATIIDPAVYYGHYEAELAMTELFGRFPERFYDAYNEVLPVTAEYHRTRKNLYGLYHILNHLNLFGSGYASQAKSMAAQLL